jgi:hypothetical protein
MPLDLIMPKHWPLYLTVAVISSAIIALIWYLLESIQKRSLRRKLSEFLLFRINPFILGTIELTIFPILMTKETAIYIGGWITIKTVSSFKLWEKDRDIYQRFLIGNAMVLITSYALRACNYFF